MGRGWTDTVSVVGLRPFTQGGFYADALAGYAYSGNQMQRQIQIPGLQRTATAAPAPTSSWARSRPATARRLDDGGQLTPFARLQGRGTTQNAFSEWGANSLSLNVAQQTTNSLRTVFGADLAGAIPLGNRARAGPHLRLGWLHEYADTGRPITAAFAGAPSARSPSMAPRRQRDAAVIGFSAGTNIAEATQLYLRYDGELSTGTEQPRAHGRPAHVLVVSREARPASWRHAPRHRLRPA